MAITSKGYLLRIKIKFLLSGVFGWENFGTEAGAHMIQKAHGACSCLSCVMGFQPRKRNIVEGCPVHYLRVCIKSCEKDQVRMRFSWILMALVWLMESAAWSGKPRLGCFFLCVVSSLRRNYITEKKELPFFVSDALKTNT